MQAQEHKMELPSRYELEYDDRYREAHAACMKCDLEYNRMYWALLNLNVRNHDNWKVTKHIKQELEDRLRAQIEALADMRSSDEYDRSTLYL